MDFVNLKKNIEKIGKIFSRQKISDKEATPVETKSTEASSLDALATYSQAMINFKGNISSDDSEKRLSDFKLKVKQNPDDYKWLEDSLEYIDKNNVFFVKQLCSKLNNLGKSDLRKKLFQERVKNAIKAMSIDIEFVEKLWYSEDKNGKDLFPDKLEIAEILECTNSDNIELAKELCYGKDKNGNDLFSVKYAIMDILCRTNAENIELAKELCFGKDENGNDLFFEKDKISDILWHTNAWNIEFARELCFGKYENGLELFSRKGKISKILDCTNAKNLEFAKELCFGKDENGNDLFFRTDIIDDILLNTKAENIEFARELCFGKDENGNDLFSEKDEISSILWCTNAENIDLVRELCFDKDKNANDLFPNKDKIASILYSSKEKNVDLKIYLKMLKEGEITPNMLIAIFDKYTDVSLKDIKKLKSVLDFQTLSTLSAYDLSIASKMIALAKKQDINEIDLAKKKSVIRDIVSLNTDLYQVSDELKQAFPLIPSNKEEYCLLLQNLSKSIGIETSELTVEQINKFNANIAGMASSLAKLSDEEFNSLSFEQEYPKSEFIKNTFESVKDLKSTERQKVYDYFGFELKHNDNGTQVDDNKKHSFSIIGYPVNLNNGKKLAKIEDPNTKAVVEKLRSEVVKFSENNHVSCINKEIEGFVNKILDLCPELRTEIGRKQAGFHEFDVFKHSLKVMQKIVQNPNYDNLSKSDKKIMLMASMFHDITKAEAKPDPTHPNECSFDTFYITKKFKLTKEERNKLYELIKHHEWLGYTNRKDIKTEEERESRIKSVAYDLHYDNLFELSKIFTEADLKAVRSSDLLYNEVEDVFKTNSSRVEAYVNELKTNQPLLPVTKIPSSTKIKKAITVVNPNGSTNLKGIYQDKNGMVIIKFNEVENNTWEKIGFSKGSVSSGINATGYSKKHGNISENIVDTGNIKFFAHGLNYPEQMRNFDAFALPDSDALLSVSYMERPESKYKLFRPYGLLLDVDTKDVHGGGESDSGSGLKKSLDLFKKDYAYSEGYGHCNRIYVADLIKEALNLTDDEYIEFVKNNANKPISEIEPKEYQEQLVKAFATINSNERKGERSYNEMYITNPKPMGIYAYSYLNSIGNIMEFISQQKDFLKEYALEKDMPFIVFGD